MASDISIPISALEEHFFCPICLGLMKDVTLTVCGHRFCEPCIKQSIQNWKKCPVCNKGITSDSSLISDHGFNGLIGLVEKEKGSAEDHRFKRLIHQINKSQNNSSSSSDGTNDEITPVEAVLQKHLKRSLIEFELYSHELRRRTLLNVTNGDNGDQNVEEIESLLRTTLQSVTLAYDRFLTENLPKISLLPVNVDVKVHNKPFNLPSVTIKPSTGLNDLRSEVYKLLSSLDDPIISFPADDIIFVLVRAFMKGTVQVTPDLITSLSEQQLHPDYRYSDAPVVLFLEGSHPLMDYHVTPKSEIIVYGPMKFVSDLPKQCFKDAFKCGETKIDYFYCQDCSTKWICRTCREICHKNHQVKVHVLGHEPGWACCYCPRSKRCTLKT